MDVRMLLTLSLLPTVVLASDKIVRFVNRQTNSHWTAGKNKLTENSISPVGTRWLNNQAYDSLPSHKGYHPALRSIIPREFDARKQWPNCTTISEIRMQGSCGSCWAHAVTEVMSDRICIFSASQDIYVHLSVEDLMSCCKKCGSCNGGFVEFGLAYYNSIGIVTGANYGDRVTGCRPYSISPNITAGWKYNTSTPECRRSCTGGYRNRYFDDLYKGVSWYAISKITAFGTVTAATEQNMQLEIMKNGPITCSIKVYEDFGVYKSGVYAHLTGRLLGGHAMKCLGWGVDERSKQPYWLVANSWGTDWGEDGFVRILRGKNECGIEARANAANPRRSD